MNTFHIIFGALLFFASTLFATEQRIEKETYLNFSDVYVQKSRGIVEPKELLLNGMFPNGCHKWLKAEVTHLDKFTHEVRGLSKVAQGMCIMVMVPFTKEVDLGQLAEGEHLVRVINGDGTTIEKTFTMNR